MCVSFTENIVKNLASKMFKLKITFALLISSIDNLIMVERLI